MRHVVALQIPRHLQLRPHPKSYKTCTVMVHDVNGSGEPRKLVGRCQGFFNRAGLQGYASWHHKTSGYSFVGEWRAGKRAYGKWIYPSRSPLNKTVYTGRFKNDREYRKGRLQHGVYHKYDHTWDRGQTFKSPLVPYSESYVDNS